LGPNGTVFVTGYTYSYGAGKNDIYLLQFILDQCPGALPEDTDVVIAGYDIFILMGIAFVVSTILIKRKQ